jgi:uncharacterized RDD family membrane protein YckC
MRPGLEDTLAAPPAAPADRTATGPLDRTATAVPVAKPAADPGAKLATGQQLGHFRIERPLGAGGMGEVYLATDLALDRPVAIKVLPAAVARDPVSRDRMVREARAQARVIHPNVGHIYFIGEEAGRLYFAMELVAGETLAARVAAGPLSVDDALAYTRAAALGLREAQRAGITHRDVKPSNLMLDGHGMVKVLDFGLAAGHVGGVLGEGPVEQTTMAGTPLYMAPEQARGEPVDFRADIYALGATLYHLVAGRPPFQADDLGSLLSQHASANRPAVPRRSGVARTTSVAIDRLIARMMAPAPADRFASYDELIRAIELASVEHMRPAGVGVRTMATLVDFLIVGAPIGALLAVASYLLERHTNNNAFLAAGYGLYVTLLTARLGRTPGQWLFELEVVDAATGQRPTRLRSLIRFAASAGPACAAMFIDALPDWVFGVALVLPMCLLMWASLRSLTKQTVWDQLSKTLVRYRTRRAPSP